MFTPQPLYLKSKYLKFLSKYININWTHPTFYIRIILSVVSIIRAAQQFFLQLQLTDADSK